LFLQFSLKPQEPAVPQPAWMKAQVGEKAETL
jgi:hypothetical protein